MAKRITKFSKLSKHIAKSIMYQIAEGTLRTMDIKAADGSSKHGVLYTVDDEETLIILDNISSAEDLEKIEEEIQNAKDSDLIDAQEVEDLD